MTLAAFKKLIHLGTRLRCTEQTYRPELAGLERTVVLTRGNSFAWTIGDGSTGSGGKEKQWTYWPKMKDVVKITGNSIRFKLFPNRKEKSHHVVELVVLTEETEQKIAATTKATSAT